LYNVRRPHSGLGWRTPAEYAATFEPQPARSKEHHKPPEPLSRWIKIGGKVRIVRQWARRGTRPRQPADQRYESAYLFGAVCPARGTGAALAMPYADTEAMQLHLKEISRAVARGAHAVLLLDRAGWHTTGALNVPKNMTLIFLPARSPELNPVERVAFRPKRQSPRFSYPNTPTTSLFIVRRKSMPGRASISTARHWPTGSAAPPSCFGRSMSGYCSG
jgi:hypothetical protein